MRPIVFALAAVVSTWGCGLCLAATQGDVSAAPASLDTETTDAQASARPLDGRKSDSGLGTGFAGHYSCATFSGIDKELCIAVSDEQPEEVKRLLEAGANIDARSNGSLTKGMTPLVLAVWHQWGHSAVQLLVDEGADVNAKDGRGNSALTYAMQARPAVPLPIVELLIKAGAGVNAKGEKGMTALMHGSMRDDVLAVKTLLEAGADVRTADDTGWTALMHATRRNGGDRRIIQLLIEAGSNVNAAHRRGGTALISASYNGHVQAVELLVNAGADVQARDEAGWTALLAASVNGHTRVAKLLAKAGAKVPTENRLWQTALSVASENGHTEIVRLLRNAKGAAEGGSSASRSELPRTADSPKPPAAAPPRAPAAASRPARTYPTPPARTSYPPRRRLLPWSRWGSGRR